MAKKTPIEKLQGNIEKILRDYQNGVLLTAEDVTKKFGQKGALAVRQEASAQGWGKNTGYDKGWKSKLVKERLSYRAYIYNDKPGLPHLLEKGHAKRGGGRTRAFPHVAPVEKELNSEYFNAMREEL